MTQLQKIGAALVAVVAAVVTLLNVFDVVHWSAAQSTGVSVTASLFVALALAVWSHVQPDTKQEPVLIAGALSAFITALLGLLVLFDVLDLTADEIAEVAAAAVVFLGFGGAIFARSRVVASVTPPPV